LDNPVEGLEVERPDRVRVADITYIRLRNEFVNLYMDMDMVAWCVRGWRPGRGPERELTVTSLGRALEGGGLRPLALGVEIRSGRRPRRRRTRFLDV